MENKITIEIDDQQTLVVLKNSEGHSFEFNPNTKFGEELSDFLILSEKHNKTLLFGQNSKKIISTLKDLKKIVLRYEKEKQGLFQWELPLLDDVDKIVKILEQYD